MNLFFLISAFLTFVSCGSQKLYLSYTIGEANKQFCLKKSAQEMLSYFDTSSLRVEKEGGFEYYIFDKLGIHIINTSPMSITFSFQDQYIPGPFKSSTAFYPKNKFEGKLNIDENTIMEDTKFGSVVENLRNKSTYFEFVKRGMPEFEKNIGISMCAIRKSDTWIKIFFSRDSVVTNVELTLAESDLSK